MSLRHWVIGAGGLLGSAVARQLSVESEETFVGPVVRWGTDQAAADLETGLAEFLTPTMIAAEETTWAIYWCAGAATTSGSRDVFEREELVFTRFVQAMKALPTKIQENGVFFFASSAGAVYAGGALPPFTELSTVAPLGEYGESKLRHEDILAEISSSTRIRVAVGRISNLYGPGQSLLKQQGLVSRLCLASLTGVPLSIFVSIDTMRDYLFVDDCARLVLLLADHVRSGTNRSSMKILASGRSVTIGALIGILAQVVGRKPLVLWGQSGEARLQSTDLRLRSIVAPEVSLGDPTNLTDGAARTFEDLRRKYAGAGL